MAATITSRPTTYTGHYDTSGFFQAMLLPANEPGYFKATSGLYTTDGMRYVFRILNSVGTTVSTHKVLPAPNGEGWFDSCNVVKNFLSYDTDNFSTPATTYKKAIGAVYEFKISVSEEVDGCIITGVTSTSPAKVTTQPFTQPTNFIGSKITFKYLPGITAYGQPEMYVRNPTYNVSGLVTGFDLFNAPTGGSAATMTGTFSGTGVIQVENNLIPRQETAQTVDSNFFRAWAGTKSDTRYFSDYGAQDRLTLAGHSYLVASFVGPGGYYSAGVGAISYYPNFYGTGPTAGKYVGYRRDKTDFNFLAQEFDSGPSIKFKPVGENDYETISLFHSPNSTIARAMLVFWFDEDKITKPEFAQDSVTVSTDVTDMFVAGDPDLPSYVNWAWAPVSGLTNGLALSPTTAAVDINQTRIEVGIGPRNLRQSSAIWTHKDGSTSTGLDLAEGTKYVVKLVFYVGSSFTLSTDLGSLTIPAVPYANNTNGMDPEGGPYFYHINKLFCDSSQDSETIRLMWVNARGGWDFWNFNLSTDSSLIEKNSYIKGDSPSSTISTRGETIYHLQRTKKYRIAGGITSIDETSFFEQLSSSPEVYWIRTLPGQLSTYPNPTTSTNVPTQLIPVIIKTEEFMRQIKRKEKMKEYVFDMVLANKKMLK